MAKKTVLVTGASGSVGKATLKELGKYADVLDVRAGTRDPAKHADLAGLASNVTVVAADSQSMSAALAGVDYAFVIPPTCKERAEIVEGIIQKAKAAGVSLLLLLSVDIVPGTVFGTQYAKMNSAAEGSGLPTVILNANWFMDNLLHCSTTEQIKEKSSITHPLDGGAVHAESSVEDIGAVAAKILSDPSPHVGKMYNLSAPPFCWNDIVRALSDALGRTIAYVPTSLEEWKIGFSEFCPEWMVTGLSEIYTLIETRDPVMTPPDGPANVEKILGRPATTIEGFVNSKSLLFA